MRCRKLALLSLLTASLLALGISFNSASASDADLISGGNPPGGWTIAPEVYYEMFGPLGTDSPQGTLVSDSGFRPYPHGFPIPNWGSNDSFIESQLIYGTPSRLSLQGFQSGNGRPPSSLNSLSLRRTFGDGVCRDAKAINPKTGSCELIFGAELLADMIETSAEGGHCFGMAVAAAALYNGQLPGNQVGASGLGINAANQMGQPAVQSITRLYGTQLFNTAIKSAFKADETPLEIVETLIADLQGGTVPYVLSLIGDDGGHAVTPFAVLTRGNGLFDIAVYDNNFPMRARAVTVDTTAETFTYRSSLNPNTPGIEWSTQKNSILGLVPVDFALDTQQCPVCIGPDQGTLVAFTSINDDNADEITLRLIDADGQPLDQSLYIVNNPLNPPGADQVSQPIITVAPGVDFGVVVIVGKLASAQPMEIYAISNGQSQYTLIDELISNSTNVFGVGKDGMTVFESSKVSSPRILQLSDQPKTSFDVNGHPKLLPAGVTAFQEWNYKKDRVEYRSTAKKPLSWNIQIGGLDRNGSSDFVGLNVKVPAGGKIVVDYSNVFTASPPRAWVQTGSGQRTNVILEAVTEQLIDTYRDQLYAPVGPN
jgi:hypothetical protein